MPPIVPNESVRTPVTVRLTLNGPVPGVTGSAGPPGVAKVTLDAERSPETVRPPVTMAAPKTLTVPDSASVPFSTSLYGRASPDIMLPSASTMSAPACGDCGSAPVGG